MMFPENEHAVRSGPWLPGPRSGAALTLLALVLGMTHGVSAQSLGDTASALPGFVGLGALGPRTSHVGLAVEAGYGYTGAVLEQDDRHHRMTGSLAAGWRAAEWLDVGLSLDGRFDTHDVGEESDQGWVGMPGVTLRAGHGVGGGFRLGGQVRGWLPGSDFPSLVPQAAIVEMSALSTWHPEGLPWWLGAKLGYRLDRSAEAYRRPARYTPGDRVALAASDFDALVASLGAAWRVSRWELLAEWSWEPYLGSAAPSPLGSPMSLRAGARWQPNEDVPIRAQLSAEAMLTRPPTPNASTHVPLPPYFTVHAGLRIRLGRIGASEPARPLPRDLDAAEAEPAPEPETGTVKVAIRFEDGEPAAGAELLLDDAEKARTSDAQGRVSLTDLEPGTHILRAHLDGYAPTEEQVQVDAGRTLETEVVLLPEMPSGLLKGVVRSMSGKPLKARISIRPGDITLESDANGRFEVPLEPGAYRLRVHAPGHRIQRRSFVIQQNSVTFWNFDLWPER